MRHAPVRLPSNTAVLNVSYRNGVKQTMLMAAILTALLLAPPVVIAAFWRASLRRPNRKMGELPDGATIVFVRLGAVFCAVLPIAQLIAWIVRYRMGELGIYLWFLLPGIGVLLALFVLSGLLAHARGYERPVSSGMLLLSVGMLLLFMFLGSPYAG